MAFPDSWTQVLVTGRYILSTGEPARGSVEFSVYPNKRIVSPLDGTIVVPEKISVSLDDNGAFSVLVPATDDPNVFPNFVWQVRESFGHNVRFTHHIDVPHDLESLDISHAAELEPGVDLYSYIRRSGDSMTGHLVLSGNPVDPMHAATKGYVDTNIESAIDEALSSLPESDFNSVVYTFFSPAGNWLINHNLGRYPQVTILDDGGEEVDSDITHNNTNQLIIVFSQPLQGKAVLT